MDKRQLNCAEAAISKVFSTVTASFAIDDGDDGDVYTVA